MNLESEREAVLLDLLKHPLMAHKLLFGHRHGDETALMHKQVMKWLHSKRELISIIAFRGSGKSTYAEEAVLLQAAFRVFKHCLFIGGNADLASERLHSIRHEVETNEAIAELFGDLRGSVWSDQRIELSNGTLIRALGRGQQIRGTKGDDVRPDFVILDDIEDKDSVRTPKARDDTERWLMMEVMPALNPGAPVRALSNILDPDGLPMRLKRHGSGWYTHTYPIEYKDQDGQRLSSWPARFPLERIDEIRKRYTAQGRTSIFEMEYMCRAEADELKPFRREMIKTEARARTWQTVQGWIDPARTIRESSADTGFASWSWTGSQLVVWEAWGKKLLPNQIVDEIFAYYARSSPAWIGLDEIGLSEFLMQPLRAEQARRGILLPLKTLPAPKSKTEQIRALQPFFASKEVVFAQPLPDLESQLVNFPSGLRDILDALSNALRMRGGVPVFEDFGAEHIGPGLRPNSMDRLCLALNATASMVTAVLVAQTNGLVRIYRDWVREGSPDATLEGIIRDARMEAGGDVVCVASPSHFNRFHNVGLVQAARRCGVEVKPGTTPDRGETEIRGLLRRRLRGLPALQCSDLGNWTANALAGSYCKSVLPSGMLSAEPESGPYRILAEGLQSLVGLSALGALDEDGIAEARFSTDKEGRQYASALPSAQRLTRELKVQ